MLALNGIFILVTKHGLEYPMFYQRLYNLLSADAFQVLLLTWRQKFTAAGDWPAQILWDCCVWHYHDFVAAASPSTPPMCTITCTISKGVSKRDVLPGEAP